MWHHATDPRSHAVSHCAIKQPLLFDAPHRRSLRRTQEAQQNSFAAKDLGPRGQGPNQQTPFCLSRNIVFHKSGIAEAHGSCVLQARCASPGDRSRLEGFCSEEVLTVLNDNEARTRLVVCNLANAVATRRLRNSLPSWMLSLTKWWRWSLTRPTCAL